MQKSTSYYRKTKRSRIGGKLTFLLTGVILLTGCQTSLPNGCILQTSDLVIQDIPGPKDKNGEMATDLRNMIDFVKEDNERKRNMKKIINLCNGG